MKRKFSRAAVKARFLRRFTPLWKTVTLDIFNEQWRNHGRP